MERLKLFPGEVSYELLGKRNARAESWHLIFHIEKILSIILPLQQDERSDIISDYLVQGHSLIQFLLVRTIEIITTECQGGTGREKFA